ncbi:MAG: PAS-domain containing protein [Rhodospirillaceae bacterium]
MESPEAGPLASEAAARLQKLERRLDEVAARMNLIMDNVPAGIVLLKPVPGERPDFLITAVNHNVNKVAGFSRKYLFEGRSLAECLRPAAADGMYGECEIDRRIAERMAWYASRPDETIWSVFPSVGGRWVKATRSPHGDFGFVVVTVDTTEQVRAERALAEKSGQFDLMMTNIPEGIFMCSPDLTVVACHPRVNAMLGVGEGCMRVGSKLEDSIRAAAQAGLYGDDPREVEALVRWRLDWYASRPDETISIVYPADQGRFLKFTRSPVGEYGMVVLFVDITEQMRIESDLKAARDRAEAALADLLATQDHLVQAEKMASLGRLVAGAAHEINTPLGVSVTVASLFSQRLQELAAELAAGRLRRSQMEQYIADGREGCELLMANIQRAADLVHSFKQVAADQTSDELRRFEMGRCLADIVASIGPVWRKAGHRVDIVCPERVDLYGHPGAISQIVTNLITNSVIHGFEPGQSGVLTIAAALAGPETVELRYGDTGKGIPPAMRSQVFEPFFTTRRNAGSTGLGLHIIYNLVVGRLGGSIELESGDGNGARFVIRFPRSPEAGH